MLRTDLRRASPAITDRFALLPAETIGSQVLSLRQAAASGYRGAAGKNLATRALRAFGG